MCYKHVIRTVAILYISSWFALVLSREFWNNTSVKRGSGSSAGRATDNGLGGPGSNPGGDEIFRPSRPTLGPTQPPVQWVMGLSRA